MLGSVPVLIDDLEPAGLLLVKIPEPKARWARGDALVDAALTAWEASEGIDGDRWRMRAALDAALRRCQDALYEPGPAREETP